MTTCRLLAEWLYIRSIPNKEFYVIITCKITRVSNFLRILGNYTHAQTVVIGRSLFPSHRTPGYEANNAPVPASANLAKSMNIIKSSLAPYAPVHVAYAKCKPEGGRNIEAARQEQ